jgi:hypothetical protein
LRCLLIIFKDYGYYKKTAKNYEALYVVCYYNTCNLAPILAFKLMNKPVYEIQHGYMGTDHFCYNKKIILSKNIFIPNKFILWRGENIPYLNINSVIHNNSYPEVKKFKKKTKKIVIGFTMSVEQISNSVVNFINKNSENYIWLIKQHPTDDMNLLERDDIKKISLNKNIILKDKTLSVQEFLKNANIHFTEDSSSVYEAYFCGIYSVTNSYRLYKRYKIKLGKFLLYTKNKNMNFIIKKINV